MLRNTPERVDVTWTGGGMSLDVGKVEVRSFGTIKWQAEVTVVALFAVLP